MADDLIVKFFQSDTLDRIKLLADEQTALAIRAYLGESAFAELNKLVDQIDVAAHLSSKAPPNLVFVPGVMGSLLKSDTKGGVWWIDARSRQHLDDLRLSVDGSDDFDPNNQVVPFAVDTSYEPFATAVLARDDLGHKNFAYDWRKSFSRNTASLRNLIIDMHGKNGGQPVHIVAHSMGGLMTRATLMEFGDELWPIVGRIAFVATPHYGSPAIVGYLKNHFWGFNLMALLGQYLSRDTFRSLWGVLTLLPAPAGVYPGTLATDNPRWSAPSSTAFFYSHPCANFDLYDASAWDLGLSTSETANLQVILDSAGDFHLRLHNWHAGLNQDYRDRMLMIAGVGYKTLFRLEYQSKLLGLWESMEKVTIRVPGDPHRDGDGRVPLASATLKGVTMRYVKGVHGELTNMKPVYEDVFRWLNDEALSSLPTTPDDALSEHLSAAPTKSDAPHLDGSATARGDDPGYLQMSPLDPITAQALDAEIERGVLPEFNHIRLL